MENVKYLYESVERTDCPDCEGLKLHSVGIIICDNNTVVGKVKECFACAKITTEYREVYVL